MGLGRPSDCVFRCSLASLHSNEVVSKVFVALAGLLFRSQIRRGTGPGCVSRTRKWLLRQRRCCGGGTVRWVSYVEAKFTSTTQKADLCTDDDVAAETFALLNHFL